MKVAGRKKLLTHVVLCKSEVLLTVPRCFVCSSEDCSVCPVHPQKKKHYVMEDPH